MPRQIPYLTPSPTSRVNLNVENPPIISIGRSAWPSDQNSPSRVSRSSFQVAMENFQDLQPLTTMSGRMPLPWDEDFASEPFRYRGIQRGTGSLFGPPPSPEISRASPQMFESYLIGHYELLLQTMTDLLALLKNATYTGAELALENLGGLGTKRAWTLIVKTHVQNFGAATKVKNMWLSMNFVEVSTYPTYCDGWTVIRSEWKLKEAVNR